MPSRRRLPLGMNLVALKKLLQQILQLKQAQPAARNFGELLLQSPLWCLQSRQVTAHPLSLVAHFIDNTKNKILALTSMRAQRFLEPCPRLPLVALPSLATL